MPAGANNGKLFIVLSSDLCISLLTRARISLKKIILLFLNLLTRGNIVARRRLSCDLMSDGCNTLCCDAKHVLRNLRFNRDSPDESQTGINVRAFPALLQDRREVLTATSTSGNPNAWSRV